MSVTEIRYAFGANWASFVARALNERRVANAVDSLKRLLGSETLEGRTFLDVGCGSGLFSLAACLLGATRVVSFDYDPNSVETSRSLRARFEIPEERWSIQRGSVLDPAFLATLEPADVLYSWGVLHHTGAMWEAIDAAAGRVKPGGLFALSIYNKVERFPDSSAMWWRIKRFYNRSPGAVRALMEWAYVSRYVAVRLVSLRNPFAELADDRGDGKRGMDFWHDMHDWLGGFPYEFATAGEVFGHVHGRLGLTLEALVTCDGNVCNEFVFRRPGSAQGARV
jgi:2-polyprenyl-6-hydroxyphenyl methylase/3-demethylubiquinone-9 3-methyltransferase